MFKMFYCNILNGDADCVRRLVRCDLIAVSVTVLDVLQAEIEE